MKTPKANARRTDSASRRAPVSAGTAKGGAKAPKAAPRAKNGAAKGGGSTDNAVHIGIPLAQRQSVISVLQVCLANAYLLLVKTKKMHWDIVGPQFMTLHKLWDEQYNTLALSTDEIAERIRQLGGYPIGTLEGFLQKAELKESPGQVPGATNAVDLLLHDHEAITRSLRTAISSCEDDHEDAGTADFLTSLLRDHEKMAWELRSFLQGEGVQPSGSAGRGRAPSLA